MLGYKYYHRLSDDVHSLAELARLPNPTILPARDRHEIAVTHSSGQLNFLLTSIITITSPGCVFLLRNRQETNEAE